MTTIVKEINRSTPTVFRRAYIKRRLTTTGKYETDWVEVTDFVKKWGSFSFSVDDVRVNRFTQSGLRLVCRNDEGTFNPESSQSSLWYGYLTRYRTLVKLVAGYVQDDGTELPTDSTQGIFMMDGEILIDGKKNEAAINCVGLTSIFQNTNADAVSAILNTLTASEVVAKIRDHSDGAGNNVFREIITSTSWSIQSTTFNYFFATNAVQGMSVWDLMSDLAEAEGYIFNMKRDGAIEFRDRSARTTTVQFSFDGEGSSRPNIIDLDWRKEAIDKFYSLVRIKYLEPDTTTSFRQIGTTTVVDSSNTAWKYGVKRLDLENLFVLNTSTADSIITNLYSIFSSMKQEFQITTKFIPHLDISDRVAINWTSFGLGARVWDAEDWASDAAVLEFDGLSWDPEHGENFDLSNFNCMILSKDTNLEEFTTTFVLREV